jgi:eukaryotic-like serine/threonine-protein kinase
MMLTKGGAKLLDFGLAKPHEHAVVSGQTMTTVAESLTAQGTILGTLHYMAPEQLQGAEADTRTDVFGFGCVLYEMLSGRRAFGGDTPASVIAAVLEHEPAPLPASAQDITPPALDAIIRTCLAKNPEDRWSSGHDVWLALRRLGDAGEAPRALTPSVAQSRRVVILSVIAGMALATIVAALYRPWSRPPTSAAAPAVQAFIDFRHVWLMSPMLPPDGRYVSLFAFAGAGGQNGRTIFVRRLADGQTTWLAGTEHAMPLTWSPESRSLAVVVNGEIRAVDSDTGSTRTIGRAPDGMVPSDGAWNGEYILLGGPRLRRMSVADDHVTDVYPGDPEVSLQYLPSFLPGGRRFLYSQDSKNQARRGLFLGTMGSSDITRLLPEPARAIVSPRGYLLYGRLGRLFAQRFDAGHNRVAGDPASIGSDLDFRGPSAAFDISGDTLVWSTADVFPPAKLT